MTLVLKVPDRQRDSLRRSRPFDAGRLRRVFAANIRVVRLGCGERASRLLLWTHYYDPHAIDSSTSLAGKFGSPELILRNGVTIQIARYEYQEALNWSGFCGGFAEYCKWITKDSLIEYLGALDYNEIEIGEDSKDHPNDPAILLCAHKS